MRRRRLGVPVALFAAVAVAQVAVLLLRPRVSLPLHAPVSPRSYFSAPELERAHDFRAPQLWLAGAMLMLEAGALVLMARRHPRRLRELRRRPVLAGAGVAGAIAVVVTLSTLPVVAISRQRAIDVGLVTDSWPSWAGDVAISTGISVVLAALGGAVLIALQRRFGRRWWIPGTVVVVAAGVVMTLAGPVVIDPLFNRFDRLPAGQTRSDVTELARRAGVDVGEIYRVDASRRGTDINAYVSGLGHTKRVVLYDTLLHEFDRAEVGSVVAHELGHVRHRDVPRGLLFLLLVAPVGLWAAARVGDAVTPRGVMTGTPAGLPAAVLGIALVAFALGTVSNQLSRRVEASADAFALRLTGAPQPFVAFQRSVAIKNLADPRTPGWVSFLLGTHPTTLERIGAAVAFEKAHATARPG